MNSPNVRTLFTDQELSDLNEDRLERVRRMLGEGMADQALAEVKSWLAAHERCVAGLEDWCQDLVAYHERSARSRSMGALKAEIVAMARALNEEAQVSAASTLRVPSGEGFVDLSELEEAYEGRRSLLRRSHAIASDSVALVLTKIYRSGGPDGLEAAYRETGERTLFRWMPKDLNRPLRKRVLSWLSLLRGNFSQVSVEESATSVDLRQDPCGTCARQLLDGRYAHDEFAVVAEAHPVTWNRGGVPIYRTHVAVMHDIVPMERTGVPWPAFACPAGVGTTPCVVSIAKLGA